MSSIPGTRNRKVSVSLLYFLLFSPLFSLSFSLFFLYLSISGPRPITDKNEEFHCNPIGATTPLGASRPFPQAMQNSQDNFGTNWLFPLGPNLLHLYGFKKITLHCDPSIPPEESNFGPSGPKVGNGVENEFPGPSRPRGPKKLKTESKKSQKSGKF